MTVLNRAAVKTKVARSLVEHIPNSTGQLLEREWFGQQIDPGVEPAVMDDRIS